MPTVARLDLVERFPATQIAGGIPRENILLIGDSLSSDISGGKNYGIDTCWMTPKNTPEDPAVVPDYRISDLRQLLDILP